MPDFWEHVSGAEVRLYPGAGGESMLFLSGRPSEVAAISPVAA